MPSLPRHLAALLCAGFVTMCLLGPAGAETEPGSATAAMTRAARMKQLQRDRALHQPMGRLERKRRVMRQLRQFGVANPVGNRIRAWSRPEPRAADPAPGARPLPLGLSAITSNRRMNNPTGDIPNAGQSEVSIAADGPYMVAAWNDGQGFVSGTSSQGFATSTDGGITWADGGSPPSAIVGTWTSDPVLVVNEKTHAFYFAALCDINSGTNGVGVVKGTFSGGGLFSWGTPRVVVSASYSNAIFDKEWLAVDSLSGNLYVSYARFQVSFGSVTSNRIDFSRSTDDGTTWSVPITLSDPDDAGRVQGVRLVVGPGPSPVLHAVWSAIGSGTDTLDHFRVRRSTSAGASFGAEITAASYFNNFGNGAPGFNRDLGIGFPSYTVDKTTGPNRGRVYLCWNESVNFFLDPLGDGTAQSEAEPNNAVNNATTFIPGQVVRGINAITTDLDYFKFPMATGQTVIFFLDSLTTTHQASLRVFCPDGVTELAYTQTGVGGTAVIVWSAPVAGDYYLRIASLFQNTTGRYVIQTGYYHDQFDRARDHRDVFVKPSPDGQTWVLPAVMVNDDPTGHDNWLPEVAVAGNGKPYVAWYDYRDSDPCGGSAHVYLARSDDAGLGWSTGSPVTTTATNWTFVDTNIEPNQGDYMALFANNDGIHVAWSDGRDGNPNAYMGTVPLAYTATEVSLASAIATSEAVTIEWSAPAEPGLEVTVERRVDPGEWAAFERIRADAAGVLRLVDRDVAPGRRQSYRLLVRHDGHDQHVGEVTVEIPFPGPHVLSISGIRPNPTRGPISLAFTLGTGAPATVELLDVGGRRVLREAVANPSPGRHVLDLSAAGSLPPGVYVVRLTQSGRATTARVSVIR